MTNNFLDRSNYFKGLLLLVGMDKKITDEETNLIHSVGKTLGFEKSFFENAVKEFFQNEYISDKPPVFSQKRFAEAFLKDGLKFSLADRELNTKEFEWLEKVADTNHISREWLDEKLNEILRSPSQLSEDLEITKFFTHAPIT